MDLEYVKLPSGMFLNLGQVVAIAKAGLDGSGAAVTQTGASIILPPPDARALRTMLDDMAYALVEPRPAEDLMGGAR